MEISQLRYALMVSRYLNFSRAAEMLFITQPSLSQQIAKLENEIGFKIFTRSHQNVNVTDKGELFLKSASKVILEFEKLQSEIQIINTSINKAVLFGTSPLSSPFVSLALPVFASEYPENTVKLIDAHDSELIEMVLNKEIDLAIVSLPHNHPHRNRLKVIPIQEEYLCVVVKKDHPLAAKESISLDTLSDFRLMFYSTKDAPKQMLFGRMQSQNIPLPDIIELSSIDAQKNLILHGEIGIGQSGQKWWVGEKDISLVPIVPHLKSTFSIILPIDYVSSPPIEGLIDIVAIRQSGKLYFTAKGE